MRAVPWATWPAQLWQVSSMTSRRSSASCGAMAAAAAGSGVARTVAAAAAGPQAASESAPNSRMAALMAAILRFPCLEGCYLGPVGVHLGIAYAFLHVTFGLVPLAAELGRLVATKLAGLFLDLALGLVALAFDLVLHAQTSFTWRPRERTSGPVRRRSHAVGH